MIHTTITPGYLVYIMTNHDRTVFYTGVTGYLSRKLIQHAAGEGYEHGNEAMSACRDLVYIESHEQAADALQRGEKLVHWNAQKLIILIATQNPLLKSLNQDITKESASLL